MEDSELSITTIEEFTVNQRAKIHGIAVFTKEFCPLKHKQTTLVLEIKGDAYSISSKGILECKSASEAGLKKIWLDQCCEIEKDQFYRISFDYIVCGQIYEKNPERRYLDLVKKVKREEDVIRGIGSNEIEMKFSMKKLQGKQDTNFVCGIYYTTF